MKIMHSNYTGVLRKRIVLLITGCVLVLIFACNRKQQPIQVDVMSSGGFTQAYQLLAPGFMESTGILLNTVYGASLGGAPTSIPERLKRGEPADVVILAADGLESLMADGRVVGNSRVDLASSSIGMAVRAGAAIPDINTVESFKQVLLNAGSIAYSASVSGTYLSTQLFAQLGIADSIREKCIRVEGERVGSVVARGEAEIGFQQVSELLPIAGITYVGKIPAELQKITTFSAAVTTSAAHPEAAELLIRELSSPANASVIAGTGMDPVHH
ncbi:MAG: substrate-binding domain-containing protein [Saprospiraceae bacterium]|nr:substrate-binding domain-containing protein [Saprospiraceae bacterium]